MNRWNLSRAAAAARLLGAVLGLFGLAVPQRSDAYQILPKISDVDRKLGNVSTSRFWSWTGIWVVDHVLPHLKSPVHEAITLAALDCTAGPGDEMGCVTLDRVKQHRMLLYGVRWPDDPPFRLDPGKPPAVKACNASVTLRSTAQPECWRKLFDDAGRAAKAHKGTGPAFGPGTMLLYRSHYGDLQFMHAMAAYEGEPARDTQRNMRIWAEFLWGVARGAIRTDIYLRDVAVPGFAAYFPGEMTATNLFATGIVEARSHLREVALGVLLHMIQDSYSVAHASRLDAGGGECAGLPGVEAPGRIAEFHSYARQDGSLHDAADTREALARHMLEYDPSVVAVSRQLVVSWQQGRDWAAVSPYIDCALALTDPNAPATAGGFSRR
ncbi:hypothetical protein [Tahibacter caeni]|uniref:hypothetical protein n=1 Tax=Tahibacter caeni TaxID=1453545 RepID=UPI0021497A06|nr:hypothetical protein [Tahibacter caeni]